MKKIILSMAFLIGLGMANAQDVKFGVKGGLNIANISNMQIEDVKLDSRMAYHLGVMAEVKLNNQFAIQPELLYSLQGASKEVEGTTATIALDYINIPVMAKYFVIDGLSLEVGPQLGILITGESTIKGEEVDESGDIKKYVKSVDFGLNFGAGYTYNNFNLGLRYNLGLTDIRKGDEIKKTLKNGVFQLSVGYFF